MTVARSIGGKIVLTNSWDVHSASAFSGPADKDFFRGRSVIGKVKEA